MTKTYHIKFGQAFFPISPEAYKECLASRIYKVRLTVELLQEHLYKHPDEIKLMGDLEAVPTQAAPDFKDKVNTLVNTVLDKESVEAEYLVARFLRANPDIEFEDIAIERKLGVDGALSLYITRKGERE